MLYKLRIVGISPILMHSGQSIDPLLPINVQKKEINSKRGTNKTASDIALLRELDTVSALWLDSAKRPTIPATAIRAVIETGARKLKQGPQVREGLMVTDTAFEYDEARYGTALEKLKDSCQFTVPVVIQRNRVMATRAMFDLPWACEFTVDGDEELVSAEHLERWLDIGGRRIGIGDWRPEKSGTYGRFKLAAR